MQPRPNRANGAANHLRCLFITALFEFTEDHGFAKLRGQIQDCCPDMFHALALLRVQRWREGVFQNDSRARAVLALLVQRNFPRQALQMFQRAIAGYAVEKSAESAACSVVLLRISHQRHEHVLRNFLGGPGVSAHAQRKAIERALMTPVKERKSFLIAFAGAPEQHVVSFLVRDSHLMIRRSARRYMYIPLVGGISSRFRIWVDVRASTSKYMS